jgi:hypothetical protein
MTVPNPAPGRRPPGTVAELRGAAAAALEAWGVDSPEQAARLLQSWRSRPLPSHRWAEMTDADVAAVLEALFPDADAVEVTAPSPGPERVYPLPYDPADDRLDDQLLELVADLIVFRTGHPFITGPDLAALREVLHGFLYAEGGAQ